MSQSPNKPWLTGKQPGYTGYRLTVNICEDDLHRVWSDHEFASLEDEKAAFSSPQMGVQQIAHALMTEAVRREAYLDLLLKMTQDPKFLSKWQGADEAGREQVVTELSAITSEVIRGKLIRMVPGLVREMLIGFTTQREPV